MKPTGGRRAVHCASRMPANGSGAFPPKLYLRDPPQLMTQLGYRYLGIDPASPVTSARYTSDIGLADLEISQPIDCACRRYAPPPKLGSRVA